MIIGSGLLANAMDSEFIDSENVIVYAAGVSNSQNLNVQEFERERSRLSLSLNAYKESKFFIYFSTCSIYDREAISSPYVRHKLDMENLVQGHSGHLIFRLPQVAGHTPNPHTLLNYMYARIQRGEMFTVWSLATRNIIDCSDIGLLVREVVSDNKSCRIMNLANSTNYSMIQLIESFQRVLKKSAFFEVENKGVQYKIDVCEMEPYRKKLKINFDENYLDNVIKKYYA